MEVLAHLEHHLGRFLERRRHMLGHHPVVGIGQLRAGPTEPRRTDLHARVGEGPGQAPRGKLVRLPQFVGDQLRRCADLLPAGEHDQTGAGRGETVGFYLRADRAVRPRGDLIDDAEVAGLGTHLDRGGGPHPGPRRDHQVDDVVVHHDRRQLDAGAELPLIDGKQADIDSNPAGDPFDPAGLQLAGQFAEHLERVAGDQIGGRVVPVGVVFVDEQQRVAADPV